MVARGNDRIYWAPVGTETMGIPGLVHRCPTAVLISSATRDQLDYMAQGRCRYCDELLPVQITTTITGYPKPGWPGVAA
jgi:hypothetical protein